MSKKKYLLLAALITFIQFNLFSQQVHSYPIEDYLCNYALSKVFNADSCQFFSAAENLEKSFINEAEFASEKFLKKNFSKIKSNALVNFQKVTGENRGIVYALIKVNTDSAYSSLLKFNATNGVKIFVNGKPVKTVFNIYLENEYTCWINLQEGINNIVFKVLSYNADWFLQSTLLTKQQAKIYLNEKEKSFLETEVLNSQLVVKTNRSSAYIFYPGKFPDLIPDKPLLVKEYLGGEYDTLLIWYNNNLEKVSYPDKPGRYAFYSEYKGANGKKLKFSGTLYCANKGWLGWNEMLSADLDYLNLGNGNKNTWISHEEAINNYVGFTTFKTIMKEPEGAVLLSFIDAINNKRIQSNAKSTPLIYDAGYHAKLKQKIIAYKADSLHLQKPKVIDTTYTTLKASSLVKQEVKLFLDSLNLLCNEWAKVSNSPFDMVLAHKGEILFQHSFGGNENNGFSTELPTEVASITKLITGLLFAQFVDQGLIGIDDAVGKYLPDFPLEGNKAITLRQCFTHVNGFSGHGQYRGMQNHWLENRLVLSLKNDTAACKHDYNGMGYDLAGKVMEVVSGESSFSLLYKQLYNPLNLQNTKHFLDLGFSCHSTAYDLAKIGQMLLNKGSYGNLRFFSPDTFQKLLATPLNKFYPQVDENWGIGLVNHDLGLNNKDELLLSESVIGHGSATGCVFMVDLKNELVITQTRKQKGDNYSHYFFKMVELINNNLEIILN